MIILAFQSNGYCESCCRSSCTIRTSEGDQAVDGVIDPELSSHFGAPSWSCLPGHSHHKMLARVQGKHVQQETKEIVNKGGSKCQIVVNAASLFLAQKDRSIDYNTTIVENHLKKSMMATTGAHAYPVCPLPSYLTKGPQNQSRNELNPTTKNAMWAPPFPSPLSIFFPTPLLSTLGA